MEIVKFIPDGAVLETRRLVCQIIFGNVIEELVENVIERNEVNVIGRIFAIDVLDVFKNRIGDVLQLFVVVPNSVERCEEIVRYGCFDFIYAKTHIVAFFKAEFRLAKIVNRCECRFFTGRVRHDYGTCVDHLVGNICLEFDLAANPVCTFFCNCFLRKLVA